MIKWLWCKIVGTGCQWETVSRQHVRLTNGFGIVREGVRYTQQCKTCGKVIKRDLA